MPSLPHRDTELIDIRSDEQLDVTRLEPWLRARLPLAEGPLTVGQFGGGHANLTYLIRFGDQEYVLRRPPLGPIAPSSHDMKREHRVLRRLGEAFPLAPTSYVLCDDPAVLGVDFHVMERRHGFVIRREAPAELRLDPARARRLGDMIVDSLADLHGVDPRDVGLENLGRPNGYIMRQLTGSTQRWAALGCDLASIDRMVAWLHKNPPMPQTTTLLHNDYHLQNILVDVTDPTTPVAVLDWDMCTRGDPLMDLGYLLNAWVDPDDDPAWRDLSVMPYLEAGFPTRQEIVERYASRTGLDVSHVHWYHVFGVFKLAVILQQIYVRFMRGQTQDARFATLGQRVEGLAEKGLSLL